MKSLEKVNEMEKQGVISSNLARYTKCFALCEMHLTNPQATSRESERAEILLEYLREDLDSGRLQEHYGIFIEFLAGQEFWRRAA